MKDNDIRSFFNTKIIKEKTNVNNLRETSSPIINIQENLSSPQKTTEKPKTCKKRKCAEM